ncbi:histidine kinase [Pseudomonas sp. PIC25]|uniref:histidine kinase n=1 Tax=Pseudomonas sp. PIC25 TaxID=1958773 RepID=UPI0021145288|nr:histidine kinase [Pseudomonas sp. PIC25]
MNSTEDALPASRHSIVLHTTLAFVIIIGVTLASMLGGLYMADAIEGDAAAINKAGSLRMQSYRLALLADLGNPLELSEAVGEFEHTLQAPVLLQALRRHRNQPLTELHQRTLRHWALQMRPLLTSQPVDSAGFRREVTTFVQELNQFVGTLQVQSEGKLEVIRALQVGTLFVTVLIAFVVVYGIHNNLVTPLKELVALARQIGRGHFRVKANYQGDNELGLLAATLNQMSDELANLYEHLERKVDQKTAALQRSNQSLQLLFNSARALYTCPDEPTALIGSLLAGVQNTLKSGPVSLCLNSDPAFGSHTAISSVNLQPPEYCSLPDCDQCPVKQTGMTPGGTQTLSFPLRANNTELGSLRVEQTVGERLEDWQQQLLATLADLFAASLGLSRLGQQQARLALMEERAIIARELHDSLAQALSYQKLQLTRLKKQIANQHSSEALETTLGEIQGGLNAAYRQLRELLTTFRIKMDAPGLAPAVQATIKEFGSHSGVEIELDYALGHCPLSPNEEIHCLQILREALSNVIKHAQAKHCQLALYQDRQGIVHIRVDDDGIGIPTLESPGGHYGLSILHERAGSLHGRVEVGRRPEGGTRVHLTFLPGYRRINVTPEPDTAPAEPLALRGP